MKTRRLLCLATDAAATTCVLNRRVRADGSRIEFRNRSGCSQRRPARLHTADCEGLNLGGWAAEAKRIFSI